MGRGLRVWGQSWEGSPGRRKPDQRLEKQRTGGREADDSKGYLRGILDRIKLWDTVRAGGGKTKLWRDRQTDGRNDNTEKKRQTQKPRARGKEHINILAAHSLGFCETIACFSW